MRPLGIFWLLISILAGCATAHELRARSADLSMIASGKYDHLAECVATRSDSLDSGFPPVVLRIDRMSATAFVYAPIDRSSSALYDISFVQEGDNVKIEARGMATIYGTDFHPRRIWPTVIDCASTPHLSPHHP